MAVLGVIYNLQNPYLKMGGRIGREAVKGGVVLGEEAGLGGRQYWEGRLYKLTLSLYHHLKPFALCSETPYLA